MKIQVLISATILCLLTACEKQNRDDCLTGAGDEKVEIRQLPPFNSIFAEDRVNLEFRNDTAYRVEVTFGENIIKHVRTEVVDGELRIGNAARCNWVRDLSVKPRAVIYSPGFSQFNNRSSGDIYFRDSLRTDFFFYEEYNTNGVVDILVAAEEVEILVHTGRTELSIRGRAEQASLYTAGQGRLDGSELEARIALVNNSSFQNMRVRASEYLYVFIGERGDVCHFGNPDVIESELSGSGFVRQCE
jgi:hypothetical protein